MCGPRIGKESPHGNNFPAKPSLMTPRGCCPRINPRHVSWQRLAQPRWEMLLRDLVMRHMAETNSRFAAMLLNDRSMLTQTGGD